MAIYNVGVLIKALRTQKGMTQNQLAEGICSRLTVTRIESGAQKPEYNVYRNLFIRLGARNLIDTFEGIVVTETEKYLIDVIPKIQALLDNKDYNAIADAITEMEKDSRFESDFGKERLLLCKLVVELDTEKGDYEKGKEICVELLKHNRPDFDIKNIEQYFLAPDEYMRLNLYSLFLIEQQKFNEAAELLRKLIVAYERNYFVKINDEEGYRQMFGNLAHALLNSEQYEECINVTDKALKLYLRHEDLRFYYRALHIRAFSLLKLGREEGRECFVKLCCMLYATGGDLNTNLKNQREEFNEHFNLKLDSDLLSAFLLTDEK